MSREQRHIKAAIVGPEGAGKTALVQRIMTDDFSSFPSPSMHLMHRKTYPIQGESVQLELWDLRHGASPDQKTQMLHGADLVFVVYDTMNKASLEKAGIEIGMIQRNYPKAHIVVLANKRDLIPSPVLERFNSENAQALANQYGIPFSLVSAKSGSGIKRAVTESLKSVLAKHPREAAALEKPAKPAKTSLFAKFFAPKSSLSPKEADPAPKQADPAPKQAGPAPVQKPSPADEKSPTSEREMLYAIEQFLLFFRAIRPNHLTGEIRQELLKEEITMSDRIQNASLYVSLRHDIVRTEYLLLHHFYLGEDLENKEWAYFRPGQLPQVVGFLQNVLEHIEDPAITKEQKRELLSQLDETIQKVTTLLAQPEYIWKESCKLDKLPCEQGIPKEIESQLDVLHALAKKYERLVNPAAKPAEAAEAPNPAQEDEKDETLSPPIEIDELSARVLESARALLNEMDPLHENPHQEKLYRSLYSHVIASDPEYKFIVAYSFLFHHLEDLLEKKLCSSAEMLKSMLCMCIKTALHSDSQELSFIKIREISQSAMQTAEMTRKSLLLLNRIFAQQKGYKTLHTLLCTLEEADPASYSVARWLSGEKEPSASDKSIYRSVLDQALYFEYGTVVQYLLTNPAVQNKQVRWDKSNTAWLEEMAKVYSKRSAEEHSGAGALPERDLQRARIVNLLLDVGIQLEHAFKKAEVDALPEEEQYFWEVVREVAAANQTPPPYGPPSYEEAIAGANPAAFFNADQQQGQVHNGAPGGPAFK